MDYLTPLSSPERKSLGNQRQAKEQYHFRVKEGSSTKVINSRLAFFPFSPSPCPLPFNWFQSIPFLCSLPGPCLWPIPRAMLWSRASPSSKEKSKGEMVVGDVGIQEKKWVQTRFVYSSLERCKGEVIPPSLRSLRNTNKKRGVSIPCGRKQNKAWTQRDMHVLIPVPRHGQAWGRNISTLDRWVDRLPRINKCKQAEEVSVK